jgi:hypothetical protein
MITLGVQPKDGGSSPLLRSKHFSPHFGGVFFGCHPWLSYSSPFLVQLHLCQSWWQHL